MIAGIPLLARVLVAVAHVAGRRSVRWWLYTSADTSLGDDTAHSARVSKVDSVDGIIELHVTVTRVEFSPSASPNVARFTPSETLGLAATAATMASMLERLIRSVQAGPVYPTLHVQEQDAALLLVDAIPLPLHCTEDVHSAKLVAAPPAKCT